MKSRLRLHEVLAVGLRYEGMNKDAVQLQFMMAGCVLKTVSIGAPKRKLGGDGVGVDDGGGDSPERDSIIKTEFEVVLESITEGESIYVARERIKSFGVPLRMLLAMFSRLLLDLVEGQEGGEPYFIQLHNPKKNRITTKEGASDTDKPRKILVDRENNEIFIKILHILEGLQSRNLLTPATLEQPDLEAMLGRGEMGDFFFGRTPQRAGHRLLTETVVTKFREFLTVYLRLRGLEPDQAMTEDYSLNYAILEEYFSGYTSREYISSTVFNQLLTVRKIDGVDPAREVLVVCTGTKGPNIVMQGIVACPFFTQQFKGLGRFVTEYMKHKTEQDGNSLIVDPHSDATDGWKALLKSNGFLNWHGERLDAIDWG